MHDTVCAFAGLGKTKVFRKVLRNIEYVNIFKKLGKEWHLHEKMLELSESFVGILYGYHDMKDVNLLQYMLFCAKKGNCPCFKLPPCRSSLEQHCLHANY